MSAADAKRGKTDTLPIRADLASDLRAWRTECGNPSADALVFRVPRELVNAFIRDLRATGIAMVDASGRRLDVHALRHTTATHLARAGIAPRTAQRFIRYSKLDPTMQVYTDLRLLDSGDALDALPDLRADPTQPTQLRARGGGRQRGGRGRRECGDRIN